MSISTISSNISRTQKEIADIAHKVSLETKKETTCQSRIGQTQRSITKNTSENSLKSKMGEIEREQKKIADIHVKKAGFAKKDSDLMGKLLKLKQDLAKEEENERKKQAISAEKERKKLAVSAEKERKRLADLEKKQQKEQLDFQKKLKSEIESISRISQSSKQEASNYSSVSVDYDLFISHASEDKEEFVRPLAETLENLGVKVWYDEFTLRVGDSLRRSIDQGLVNSRYGTVILSSSFFSKNWPQYELDAMVAKEMEGHKMILPIWHKVTKTEVINFSPALADKVALNTSMSSIEEIAGQLAEVILDNQA